MTGLIAGILVILSWPIAGCIAMWWLANPRTVTDAFFATLVGGVFGWIIVAVVLLVWFSSRPFWSWRFR